MRVVIGTDIGGTKIAAAPIGRDGRQVGDVERRGSDTSGERGFLEGLCDALRHVVRSAQGQGHEVLAIGLGCAGTVARESGIVVVSPNLPLVNVPVARIVAERLGLPVVLDNDANVAALAEVRAGAAAGLRHAVMLTLGTGVGGGLVLEGRVFRGASGAAAELGHMVIVAGGERCRCGARGCFEAYASGTALERTAARLVESGGRPPVASAWAVVPEMAPDLPEVVDAAELSALVREDRLTGEAIGELARRGDPGARAAIAEVGAWLGLGAASLANIFEPQAIVVGGGLSSLGEGLLTPARRMLSAVALAPSRDARLVPAVFGSDAGIVGAGIVAWEEAVEGSPAGPGIEV